MFTLSSYVRLSDNGFSVDGTTTSAASFGSGNSPSQSTPKFEISDYNMKNKIGNVNAMLLLDYVTYMKDCLLLHRLSKPNVKVLLNPYFR